MFYKKQKASARVWALAFKGQWNNLCFVKRSQAPAADVNPGSAITFLNGDFLDIRKPAPLRGTLGVADIVADHWPFSTQVAANWHRKVPLSDLIELEQRGNIAQSLLLCKSVSMPKETVDG